MPVSPPRGVFCRRPATRLGGLALAASLLLSACGGGGGTASQTTPTPTPTPSTSPGALSITTNPQLIPTPADPAAALASAQDLAYGTGARGQQTDLSWGALEPSAGQFDAAKLADITSALDRAAKLSLTQYVGLQPINTLFRDLPSDLVGKAFDDPVVKQRFHALLDKIVGQHVGRIQYLSIGNEVDTYLAAHTDEVAAYTAFFRDAAAYARSLDPAIKVGVTGTADGAIGSHADLLAGLNGAGADVVIVTYYPIRFDATGAIAVRDPATVSGDVTRLLAFAGAKPLVFQEAGFPSSTLNGSSEALQASFVHELFAAWRTAGGRIPYLNLFTLHDFTTQTCDDLAVHYQFSDSSTFKAYLCSLGLRQTNGQAKAAWSTLMAEPK